MEFHATLHKKVWLQNTHKGKQVACTGVFVFSLHATSSPGPSPRSKWRSEKPLAKAAEILHESWSILSRDTWWNGFFEGCFQRLAALFVFCNRKPLIKQNEDISSCLDDEILTNFWSHFGSLSQGFLWLPFWTRRRPWGRGWFTRQIDRLVPGCHEIEARVPTSSQLSVGPCKNLRGGGGKG